jgi:PPM family protein phosphatase
MPRQQPTTSPSVSSQNAPTVRLARSTPLDDSAPLPLLPAGQNIAGQYRILKSVKLDTCNYYEVALLQSTQPGASPQVTHLIRETAARSNALSPDDFATLTGMGQLPFVLPHQQPISMEGKAYTLIRHPGPWGTLAKIKVPVSPEKAFTWTGQVAQALAALNGRGLGGFWFGKAGREAIVIVQGEAQLADVTFARRVQEQNFAHDVHALAGLLHYLLTGQELTAEAPDAPPHFRAVLRRAAGHGIHTIAAFMQELETSKQTPVYQRALRQTVGYLTHPGRVRDHNEDYVGVFQLALDQTGSAAPVGLYVVADGMGGQAAGEFASRGSVQQAFVQFINNQVLPELQRSTRRLDTATAATPKEQLENLVKVANELVYKANQATNSDRGTTITAVLIIGSQAYIANVGDSRTYLLRNGQLKQLTQDHSLVYSLFLANQITEEEIYTHPRKNEIHRSLGDKAEVKVDTFADTLQPGDKLLLCSDGLWEMVRNPYIQQTLAGTASPQAICDHLIRMANDNGGEDNITAIVVALE